LQQADAAVFVRKPQVAQHDDGHATQCIHRRLRGRRIGGGVHTAPELLEQRAAARERDGIVVDDQCREARHRMVGARDRQAPGERRRAVVEREGLPQRERRALAGSGAHVDVGTEQSRDASDDGEAEPESETAVARRIADLVELAEDRLLVFLRDADAAVAHFEQDLRTAAARGDEDAALARVANGVGDEIAEQAMQQQLVADDDERRRAKAQRNVLLRGGLQMLRLEQREEIGEPHGPALRMQAARIELGHVEQRLEEPVHDAHRLCELGDDGREVGARRTPLERRCEHADRVQRLAQVVARRRDEARLGGCRLLGRIPLRAQLPRRRRDARLQLLGAGGELRDHVVEALVQRAQFAPARHVERRHRHAGADLAHRARETADRLHDAVADRHREEDRGNHATEAEGEADRKQAPLLRLGGFPRHVDDDLPERGLLGDVQALGDIGREPGLDDGVRESDELGRIRRGVLGGAERELAPGGVANVHGRHVGLACRGIGELLQRHAVAGEECELGGGGELARDRDALPRERGIHFGDAHVREVDQQREQDRRARRKCEEEDAAADAPIVHGDDPVAARAGRRDCERTRSFSRSRTASAVASEVSSSSASPIDCAARKLTPTVK
jgi:hypothetical protein